MRKKIISDIRLYKTDAQNEFGVISFGSKELNAIVKRIVMKLRENQFSCGEFDHLYINFTTCDMPQEIHLSKKVDRYHPWYRYCDVHIEKNLYDMLGTPETYKNIVHSICAILVAYFATKDFNKAKILDCVAQAVEHGEDMLMKFKEKVSAKRKAIIFLRFLDSCRFFPLLRVYDAEGNLLLEKDLPEAVTLDYLGEIQVSAKRVTIKPRRNACITQSSPLVFEY